MCAHHIPLRHMHRDTCLKVVSPAARGQSLVQKCQQQQQKRSAGDPALSTHQPPAKRPLSAAGALAQAGSSRATGRKPSKPQRNTGVGRAAADHDADDESQADPYEFQADDSADDDFVAVQARGGGRGRGTGGPGHSQPVMHPQSRPVARNPVNPGSGPRLAGFMTPSARLQGLCRGMVRQAHPQQQQQHAHGAQLAPGGSTSGGVRECSSIGGGWNVGGRTQRDLSSWLSPTAGPVPTYTGPLPVGLVNMGNTCYLNAVLQAVLGLECLAADLCGPRLRSLPLDNKGVTRALSTCYHKLHGRLGTPAHPSPPLRPWPLKNAMANSCSSRSSCWASPAQQDAHEFFTALLEEVQGEVLFAEVGGAEEQQGGSESSSPEPASATAAVVAPPLSTPGAAGTPAAPPSSPTLGSPQEEDVGQADLLQQAAAVPLAGPDEEEAAAHCLGGSPSSAPQPAAVPGHSRAADADAPEQAAAASTPIAAAAEATPDGGAGVGSSSSGAAAAAAAAPQLRARGVRISETCDPMSRTFWGCLEQTFTCSECNHKTSRKEPFSHLSLQLTELVLELSLSELLEVYFGEEDAHKDCEACKRTMVVHKSTRHIRRLPRVLAIHLKRFHHMGANGTIAHKLQHPVKPDTQLHVGDLCVQGRPAPVLLQRSSFVPLQLAPPDAGTAAGAEPVETQPLAAGTPAAAAAAPAASPLPAAAFHGPAAADTDAGAVGGLRGGGRSTLGQLVDDKENHYAGPGVVPCIPGVPAAAAAGLPGKSSSAAVLGEQLGQLPAHQQQQPQQQLLGGAPISDTGGLSDSDIEEVPLPPKRTQSRGRCELQRAAAGPAPAAAAAGPAAGPAATVAAGGGNRPRTKQALQAAHHQQQQQQQPGGKRQRGLIESPGWHLSSAVEAAQQLAAGLKRTKASHDLGQDDYDRAAAATQANCIGVAAAAASGGADSQDGSELAAADSDSQGAVAGTPRSPEYLEVPSYSPDQPWGPQRVVTNWGGDDIGIHENNFTNHRLGSSNNLQALAHQAEDPLLDEEELLRKVMADSLLTAAQEDQRRQLQEAAGLPLEEGPQEEGTAAPATAAKAGSAGARSQGATAPGQQVPEVFEEGLDQDEQLDDEIEDPDEDGQQPGPDICAAAEIFAATPAAPPGSIRAVQQQMVKGGGLAGTPLANGTQGTGGGSAAAVGAGLALSSGSCRKAPGAGSGDLQLPFGSAPGPAGPIAAGGAGQGDDVPDWIQAAGRSTAPSTPVKGQQMRHVSAPPPLLLPAAAGSIPVVNMVDDDNEDMELQRALAESLETHRAQQAGFEGAEGNQDSPTHIPVAPAGPLGGLAAAADEPLPSAPGSPAAAGEGGSSGAQEGGAAGVATAAKPPAAPARQKRRHRPQVFLEEDSDVEAGLQPQQQQQQAGALPATPSSTACKPSPLTQPPGSAAAAAVSGSKPLRMLWSPAQLPPQQHASANYQLTAVIRHLGDTVMSGHYIADVVGPQGQWFHFNDENVHHTTVQMVTSQCIHDGYLFFYTNTAALDAAARFKGA